jgi:glycosyltransferase involved in cell wall biosynthesis
VKQHGRGANAARDTIAFVSLSRGMGGPGRSLVTTLAHLDTDLRRVLFSPPGAPASAAANRGSVDEVVQLPFSDHDRRTSQREAVRILTRYLRRHRGRIMAVHANGQSACSIATPAAAIGRLPMVVWAHASTTNERSRSLRPLWRTMGSRLRWLAVSTTAQEALAASTGVRMENIGIVPNPIDPADVVGTPIPHEGIRVGYLGVAVPHKGFDLLAPMMEALDRTDVNLDLFVAPPPSTLPLELRPAWDALAALEGRRPVYLTGRTNDVRRAYAELDIVVCPSRQESFGRVAAEAMLNGLPVVASDLPAYRELLGDNEAGLLVPVGGAEAAAAAVSRLADDAELRQRLGQAGRERARRFSPDRVVPLLEAEYRRAAGH